MCCVCCAQICYELQLKLKDVIRAKIYSGTVGQEGVCYTIHDAIVLCYVIVYSLHSYSSVFSTSAVCSDAYYQLCIAFIFVSSVTTMTVSTTIDEHLSSLLQQTVARLTSAHTTNTNSCMYTLSNFNQVHL
jgi:hypothetical protein